MRLLFAGTPEVAVPALEALLASPHEVVAVLTRPDARQGRGRRLAPSPVAELAAGQGIPVIKPASLREPQVQAQIRGLGVEAAPVVAFGGLIPPELLDAPAHGWINLHFSLLPAWRGAAPVQHALIAGDEITGASTFRIEAGLDTGPVFGTLTERVAPRDTAGDLLGRLATAGADLLVATLDAIADGSAQPVPQPADGISRAPRLTTADGRIDWGAPAIAIDRRVRGTTPSPGPWTSAPDGSRLKLGVLEPLDQDEAAGGKAPEHRHLEPGELHVTKDGVLVGTASIPVRLSQVAPAGRSWMAAADWARGARLVPGARLGGEPA